MTRGRPDTATLIAVAALLAAPLLGCASADYAEGPAPSAWSGASLSDDGAPETSAAPRGVQLQSLRGGLARLDLDAPGKPTLVALGSGRCARCRRIAGHMTRLERLYAGALETVAVSVDQDLTDARRHARWYGERATVLWDVQGVVARHLKGAPPLLVLLDADGRVVTRADAVDDALLRAVQGLVRTR